ncbi:hypothetical protein SLH48_12490 [Cytobacillus sp. IB215316]|nr:hypothetical protein [Cytobacillus sp. IB215316]
MNALLNKYFIAFIYVITMTTVLILFLNKTMIMATSESPSGTILIYTIGLIIIVMIIGKLLKKYINFISSDRQEENKHKKFFAISSLFTFLLVYCLRFF